MAQTSTNVVASKPAVGGALSVAATTATLPTDATTALDPAFTGLGYLSDDGITENVTRTVDTIKAFGGDTVLTTQTEFTNTFKCKLIEALNVDVLKEVFGASNVSGALGTGITVNVVSDEMSERAWVFDLIVRGALERLVIPCGKITEVGEISYADSSAVGYEITITAFPDSAGKYQYKYIKES